MKKQTKGIIAIVFFGGALLFWAAAASVPSIMPPDESMQVTETGTPADNFPDEKRAQFCGTGDAKSNTYVREYKIPTECTMPLSIVTDPQGNVWFTQTNTGKIAKFDPSSESFTEYENPSWPPGARSMMWGIDYSPDGSLLYTDEATDSVWKFSILDEKYDRFNFPAEGDSLPQRLEIVGSKIIINDFLGNKITFFDAAQTENELTYLSLPSPVENSVTGDFAVDQNNNLWYTNWIFQQDGVLVKFDEQGFSNLMKTSQEDVLPIHEYLSVFQLPPGLNTPNGVVADSKGNIWLADTSSSFFFSFDPESESFTQYSTSLPTASTYGNYSGLIKTPVTRPYWIELDQNERVVFNEQTANRIGIFDPNTNTLTEYLIPSKNPNWADCGLLADCGLAQVFSFTVAGEKIWFTEWVENNIGVLDTSIPLPFKVSIDTDEIVLKKGEQTQINVNFVPNYDSQSVSLVSTSTAAFDDLSIKSNVETIDLNSDEPTSIPIQVSASETALSGTYKVLIGGQTDDVTISKYLTLHVES
ncbi:MAG TPA: lyase [Nitrosopumilaceae archaeon]|nr:lyase [Nitrosopumilaceae archaeon]